MNNSSAPLRSRKSWLTRRWATITAALAATAIALTGCASASTGDASGDAGPFKVAIVADLTGAGSSSNGTAAEGFRAAFEAANADGGIDGRKIEVTTYDSKSTPDATQIAARSAVADEPSMIAFAALSSGLVGAQNVFAQAGIPVLSVSAAEELLTSDSPWYFTGGSTPAQIAESWFEVISSEVGDIKGLKVAFHGLESSTTDAIFAHARELLEDAGAEIVTYEKSNGTITSYTAQAQKIVSLGADVVIATDVLEAVVLVGQAVADAGFTGPFIGAEGASANSTFERLAGVNYIGERAFQAVTEGPAAEAAAAIDVDPSGPYFPNGWALGNLIVSGLSACEGDCDGEQMQTALEGLGDVEVPGDVTFGPLSLSADKRYAISAQQYFVWDEATSKVVPYGDPIPVS